MRFSKISITKKSVDLTRESKNANGAIEEVHLNSPERPMASFVDVLQGFRAYVVELLPLKLTEEQLTITTLNLSEDKNGSRGLIVTATMPVPKAYDKPLVLNTPLVREGGENTSADAFVLSDEVLNLIGLAEQEAARYVNGERVQLELIPKAEASANAADFNDRAAAAEVASTRKPKGRKPKKGVDFIPGQGPVMNPDATDPPTDDLLRQLLLSVERDVPVDAIARWTSAERDAAQHWASATQRLHTRQIKEGDVPAEPACLLRDATPDLMEGDWPDTMPPRVNDDGVQEILAAAERG